MGVFKQEEIVAIYEENTGAIVCAECMTEKMWDELTQDQIITREQIDGSEELFFCDECTQCDGKAL